MADLKISALTASTVPLAGTEVLPIVQSSTTKQVSIANVTAGRAVSSLTTTALGPNGIPITLQEITAAPTSATAAYVGVSTSAFPGGSNGDLILIPRTSGANDVRVYVGSGTPTEALIVQGSTKDVRIGSGNIVPATAAKGINFTANTPAAGMTSQLLNWYEEGTWTPAGNGITFSSASGTYTRIGRLVTASFTVTFPVTANASNAQATGLPFTAGANSAVALSGYNSDLNAQVNSATSLVYFANASGTAFKTNANLSTQIIIGTVSYRV